MERSKNINARRKAISTLLVCSVAQLISGSNIYAQSAGKVGTLAAIHASQQHHSIGKGELYLSGLNVKYVFNGGDLVCSFRGKENKVYLSCPAKKAVYESSLSDFRRRGLLFTSGSQTACETLKLKEAREQSQFMNMRAKTYTLLSPAATKSGELRLFDVGKITALAKPTNPNVAEFISIAYGTPSIDSLPLEMQLKYSAPDARVWFRTSPKELPAARTNYKRLITSKLENVKVAEDFFDAPKGFKKVERQENIMGMASAAKDFEELLFP